MAKWLHGPGDVRVNTFTRQAYVGTTELPLTRLLFDILVVLLENRGRVISTTELIETVWGFEEDKNQHFAQTAVYRLRKHLAAAGSENVIESVRGVGIWIRDEQVQAEHPLPSNATVALSAATTAIILIGGDGTVSWANEGACRLTGYTIDELVGDKATKILPPDRALEMPDVCRAVRGGLHHRRQDARITTKDGEVVGVYGSLKLLNAAEAGGEALLELWPLGETLGIEDRAAS
jgi:PAS domain S-box-containing protein